MKNLLVLISLLFASPALAANSVSLENEVFVERVVEENGKQTTKLEAPKVVVPGDKLVFIISYKNDGAEPATAFVVTNPLPPSIAYEGVEGTLALVSVDGGTNYGQLAALKIKQPDGTDRAAAAGDVTHIRWTFTQAIPAGGAGKLSFRGVVK